MFESLSDRLARTTASLRGRGRLTDENIRETLRQVRMALLEADVALPVVRQFIDGVRERAVGAEVAKSLTPGQALVKIIHDELVRTLGEENSALDLATQPPAVILLAGLQGAGKTTTAAKLGRLLMDRHGKRVLLASADVYRPAAILQLERLAGQIGAGFEPCEADEDPSDIVRRAIEHGRRKAFDAVIIDSAGRLHVDDEMMAEIRRVHDAAAPIETLFVVDSMAGQDAVNSARAFGAALPLTGVIVTKTDGDARGGVALSVRQITGCPIKFLGVGEKVDALEPFHPERVASRILGMGDVVSLVEDVERQVDRSKADRLARKLKSGKGFDLRDLRDQLVQMQALGGLGALVDKLPVNLPKGVDPSVGEKQLRRQVAVIDSMTERERRFPRIIDGSRKRRIAAGAGVQVQDVNRLLKQHQQMQKMMKKLGRGGLARAMRAMQGRMPPGFRP